MTAKMLCLMLGVTSSFYAPHAFARHVFLNGVDISSARHQDMENISLKIDGDGNIFIIAPHYQVNEESTYIPLSSWKQSPSAPPVKNPGVAEPNPANLPSHPALQTPPTEEGPKTAEAPKEGSKTKGEQKGEGEDE